MSSVLSKLGGAIKAGFRNGARNGILSVFNNAKSSVMSVNDVALYSDYIGEFTADSNDAEGSSNVKVNDILDNQHVAHPETVSLGMQIKKSSAFSQKIFDYQPIWERYDTKSVEKPNNEHYLDIKAPDWGYDDLIAERAIFQKGLSSQLGEPGWFYFKIFFEFDTSFGLLGGILNNNINGNTDFTISQNSAAKFLKMIHETGRYEYLKPLDRLAALEKFAGTLSYINKNAPWFFKTVRNLNEASNITENEFSKDKSIEIQCAEDAIDMRLSTLMDLYRYACYDDVNDKEILPQNLRMFDMTIVIFGAPIKYLQTASYSNGKYLPYKTLNPINGFDNVMSYKMFTFRNCEIMTESMGSMIPSEISNETPFRIGNGTIKIKYNKVYQHTMNEFDRIMFGSTGLFYNKYSADKDLVKVNKNETDQSERYNSMMRSFAEALSGGSSPNNYKTLVDASEAICHHAMMNYDNLILGNIYGEDNLSGTGAWEYNGKVIRVDSSLDYYNAKLKHLKNFSNPIKYAGANRLLKLLQSSWSASPLITSPNIYGQDLGPGTKYFEDKLDKLKHGSLHKDSDITQYEKGQMEYNNFSLDQWIRNLGR